MTLATSSSGLVPNPVPQQPFNPPIKNDWDRLFQPMFDEYFNPPQRVISLVPVAVAPCVVDIVGSPSSTTIDLVVPSSSTSSTNQQQQSSIISQGVEEPILNAQFDNPCHEPLYDVSTSQESSSNTHSSHSPLELIGRWTKDHPLANVIGNPSRPVSTRKQLKTNSMWCYFDVFLTSVEPKNFKEAMLESSWIEAIFKNKGHLYLHRKCRQQEYDDLPDGRQNGILKWRAQRRGTVDPTLFTRKAGNDLLLVQIYVDDIIFTSTNTAMCDEFANLMTTKFKMSMMGQMLFFLGLQISQSPRGIFINQSKYASEIIKKYGMLTSDSVDTPMVEKNKLDAYLQEAPFDATHYRDMIGSLMYLTSSRPDLIYGVCLCARYQAKPAEKHLHAVKQIF
ncbi:retrovirus-related pol polyprotein from transposon TNT 1-94 [Tanacetum coccineum]